ncbi:MAG: hypothetical protein F6K24_03790 [Okeania sp. SIO2D1]|nr:hypothetical protein [Okeania sp. SIO2D1]
MLTKIPEINPLDLLYNPYQPIDRYELAELLGVSLNTVYSWQEGRRQPATPVKKLAGMILSQWQTQSTAA